jgi:hypothetical protein
MFAFKEHTAPSSMTATSSVPVQSLNFEKIFGTPCLFTKRTSLL